MVVFAGLEISFSLRCLISIFVEPMSGHRGLSSALQSVGPCSIFLYILYILPAQHGHTAAIQANPIRRLCQPCFQLLRVAGNSQSGPTSPFFRKYNDQTGPLRPPNPVARSDVRAPSCSGDPYVVRAVSARQRHTLRAIADLLPTTECRICLMLARA